MPRGGADARGRQCAVIFRLAHEQAVSPALGKPLEIRKTDALALAFWCGTALLKDACEAPKNQ